MRQGAACAVQLSQRAAATLQTAVPASERVLAVHSFGDELVGYDRGLQLQQRVWERRQAGTIGDTLIQLQHPPLYSFGKRAFGDDTHLLKSRAELQRLGIELHDSPRGGEVTYHGPGQLVVYPVVGLRALGLGARAYVEGLEDCLIRVAGVYGLHARGRIKCRTGVWVGDRKLAAIGVRIAQGVSTHGVALNVSTDLSYFTHIVACGLPGARSTSLDQELGQQLAFDAVAQQFADAFVATFGYRKVEHKNTTLLED